MPKSFQASFPARIDSRLSQTIQPPSPLLRNLTLGVLIVSGGTLAALPFRRSSSDRQTLDAAVRATGPTVTPLDTSTVEVNFSPSTEVHATTIGNPSWMPRHITEPMQGERFIEMPESFSDGTAELPRPKVVEERFNASVDFQADAAVARQVADHASVMIGDLARAQLNGSQLNGAQLNGSQLYGAQMGATPAYSGPSPYARGPLVGGAMSTPVAASANRFNGLAVDAGGVSPRPLGNGNAPELATREATASRDTFVSSRAARSASESLADRSPEAEPAPPLPPVQTERPKLWIRQPN